jgi:hypothetical protein
VGSEKGGGGKTVDHSIIIKKEGKVGSRCVFLFLAIFFCLIFAFALVGDGGELQLRVVHPGTTHLPRSCAVAVLVRYELQK